MGEESVESDHLRKTLIDFAEWRGESTEDAEWAAETYLHELRTPPGRRS